MKKYLVCTLLVINAVPAQAAQAGWCKGWVGCETFTSVTDALWITAAAQKEVEEKKRLEAEALTRKRKQEELDNVPTRVQIIAMTQETLESNKKLVENQQQVYTQEDAAIATINAEDVSSLAALLEACKNGLKEKCAEHKVRIDHIYERSVTSNQRATQQGELTTKRAQLAQDLEKYKEEMLLAYEEMKAITAQEDLDMAPLTESRRQATLACDEGNACNTVIENFDAALAACKDAAHAKRRDAKAKLDTAWKNYIAARNQLNDVSDINAIAKAFALKYSVTPADVVVTQDARLALVAKSEVTQEQPTQDENVVKAPAVTPKEEGQVHETVITNNGDATQKADIDTVKEDKAEAISEEKRLC